MAFSHDLRQDAQGRWDELLSPTQVLTGSVNTLLGSGEKSVKKTRHGNRKDQRRRQRMRRRRRQLGLSINNHDSNDIHSNTQAGQYEIYRNHDVTDEHREFDEEREVISVSFSPCIKI